MLNIGMLLLICTCSSCEKIGLFGDREQANCPCESTTGSILICENFETYSEGLISPQADLWTTTSRINEDARILSEQASDGLKALQLAYEEATATQATSTLALGNYGCGMHRAAWKMYIPEGKNAFFRINKYSFDTEETGATIYFNPHAKGTVIVGGQRIEFDFYNDGWFKLEIIFDLDNDIQTIAINEQAIATWPFHYATLSTTGTIRLSNIQFEANNNGLFFLDEVCFEENIGENPYH